MRCRRARAWPKAGPCGWRCASRPRWHMHCRRWTPASASDSRPCSRRCRAPKPRLTNCPTCCGNLPGCARRVRRSSPTLEIAAQATPERIESADAPLLASAEDAMAAVGNRSLYDSMKSWFRRAIAASSPSAVEKDTAANAWRAQLNKMQITPAGCARVMAGEPLQPDDIEVTKQYFHGESPEVVLSFPQPAGLALWNSYPGKHWHTWEKTTPPRSVRSSRSHGVAALPGLAAYVQAHADDRLAIALPVDSARLVPTALHALRNLKKAQAPAIAWLRAHARTVITAALPLAFGKDKIPRDDARYGIRWLAGNGFEAQAREVAACTARRCRRRWRPCWTPTRCSCCPRACPSCRASSSRRRSAARCCATAARHCRPARWSTSARCSRSASSRRRTPAWPSSRRHAHRPRLAEFAWDLFEAWMAAGVAKQGGLGLHRAGAARRRRNRAAPRPAHPGVARRGGAPACRRRPRRAGRDRQRRRADAPARHREQGEVQGAAGARAGEDRRRRRGARLDARAARRPAGARLRPRRARHVAARLRPAPVQRRLRREAQAVRQATRKGVAAEGSARSRSRATTPALAAAATERFKRTEEGRQGRRQPAGDAPGGGPWSRAVAGPPRSSGCSSWSTRCCATWRPALVWGVYDSDGARPLLPRGGGLDARRRATSADDLPDDASVGIVAHARDAPAGAGGASVRCSPTTRSCSRSRSSAARPTR